VHFRNSPAPEKLVETKLVLVNSAGTGGLVEIPFAGLDARHMVAFFGSCFSVEWRNGLRQASLSSPDTLPTALKPSNLHRGNPKAHNSSAHRGTVANSRSVVLSAALHPTVLSTRRRDYTAHRDLLRDSKDASVTSPSAPSVLFQVREPDEAPSPAA